jgi:hypothetical protein
MIPRKWQVGLLAALGALLALLLLRSGPSESNPARSPAGSANLDPENPRPSSFGKKRETKISPDEVPDVDAGAFSAPPVKIADSSRDLFRFKEKPPPPPPPPPPPYIGPGDPRFVGPKLPPPPPPPPRPPAIPFQFTGTLGVPKAPVAVLVEGDRLILVRAGDKVDEKFIIRSVGYESLDVGFVGFPASEVRRLPLTPAS